MSKGGNGASAPNRLYFGDNHYVLEQLIAPESADLIYLDPPFNSKAIFNVLYETPQNFKETAQRTTFRDTWSWGEEAQSAYLRIQGYGGRVAAIIEGIRTTWEKKAIAAYVVTMAGAMRGSW